MAEFNGYGECVKLDLEAKNIIERTNSKPERYKLKKIKNNDIGV